MDEDELLRLDDCRKILNKFQFIAVIFPELLHNKGVVCSFIHRYVKLIKHIPVEFAAPKLVLGDGFAISIGTEFIENEAENVSKNDCETKAFKRLSERLKKEYPRLPICVLADSLYASVPVFKRCIEDDKWHVLIRYKDGSIPSIAEV